jgi:hypothetical protein
MKRTALVLAGLLLLALALLPVRSATFAAAPAQNATATPAPEPETTATPAPEEEVEEPTMADLLARIESLEATVTELYATHEAEHIASFDQVNAVNTAIYLMDSVGLHELDTQLAVDGVINPGDSGKVAQIARLLITVDWPDELAADAAATHEMLTALASALADDDLDTAKSVMLTGHATYHVLSQIGQNWVVAAAESGMSDAPGQANRVNTAVYLLDGVDLHALAERLAAGEDILPEDSGPVSQAARLLITVDWPEELAEDAAALYETLSALSLALADDDLETAAPLAEQAHDGQHDFSHNAQTWLAEHAGGDAAGHDEHSGEDAPAEHSHGG